MSSCYRIAPLRPGLPISFSKAQWYVLVLFEPKTSVFKFSSLLRIDCFQLKLHTSDEQ